jgi:hypothetical protein
VTVYWTAAEISDNIKYSNGHKAFNTAAVARSWIARRHLKAHPSRRGGKTGQAKLYDRDEVLALWYSVPIPREVAQTHRAMDRT